MCADLDREIGSAIAINVALQETVGAAQLACMLGKVVRTDEVKALVAIARSCGV